MKWMATMLLLLLSTAARSQVPEPVRAMNDLPNAAKLYRVYCSPVGKACVTIGAICFGQCGTQYIADSMGYGCSGDIEGIVPKGFRYARWFAVAYGSGAKVVGLATRGYDTKNCYNPR